jgi:hypothetical protein
MSSTNSLQKDIATLNRRYLLLVQQMANTKHPLLTASVPSWLALKVRGMTLEEIDQLAEDMIAPCFHMNLHEVNFDRVKELPHGSHRKAYMTNVLVSNPASHA